MRIKRAMIIHFFPILILLLCLIDGFLIEPEWIKVRNISLREKPSLKILHFSDLHFNGDREYLERVIGRINDIGPDMVCFTGDLVEDRSRLEEALEMIEKIQSPVFGVPGNHDYSSRSSFAAINNTFRATGGKWLVNESVEITGDILIEGIYGPKASLRGGAGGGLSLLLTHCPVAAVGIGDKIYDLILAGHSHGGQVRLPFFGAPILPGDVGKYEKGLYRTVGGPLYVNPGIGCFYIPVRFLCRPELTVIEM